jgi:hypothetical protein
MQFSVASGTVGAALLLTPRIVRQPGATKGIRIDFWEDASQAKGKWPTGQKIPNAAAIDFFDCVRNSA